MSLAIAITISWLFLEWPWRIVVVGGALLFEAFEIWLFLHLRKMRSITGAEAIVGAKGRAVTECRPRGQARIRGQLWQVTCEGGAAADQSVVVTGVDGIRLHVAPVTDGPEAW